MRLYHELEVRYLDTTSSFLNDGVTNLINNLLAPAFGSMFTLYIIFYGYNVLMGRSKEPILDGMQRILKFILIGTFALNVTYFNDWNNWGQS